jgi:hypothetical protein
MVNAQYPITASAELIEQAKQKVSSLGLEHAIELETTFLSDQDSFTLLNQADMTVFPYQETGESASGAVRYGMALDKPVAVTPLPIFADIQGAVHVLPGFDAVAIAAGLEDLMQGIQNGAPKVLAIRQQAEHWRSSHLYRYLAQRLHGVLRAALR